MNKIRGISGWVVVISTLLFFVQHLDGGWLVRELGLTPLLVLQEHKLWQLVTYQFLHAGILHWLFNMLILWMLGGLLEAQWGIGYFARFFLLTGVGAGLCVLLVMPHSSLTVIGLSGTLFGLLVAFAMTSPNSVMYIYFLFPVKAWQATLIFGLIELFIALEGGSGALTAIADLGGMAIGYSYLRWGAAIDSRLAGGLSALAFWNRPRRKPVILREVTDDLVSNVDRILDKVSAKGADSLTAAEKKILDRYTRMRR